MSFSKYKTIADAIKHTFEEPANYSKKCIKKIFSGDLDQPDFVLTCSCEPDPPKFAWATGTKDLIQNGEFHESDAFRVFCDKDACKVTLFAKECNPEPSSRHFEDLIRIMRSLNPDGFIAAASLHGAGASAPHHLHVHIRPKQFRVKGVVNHDGELVVDIGRLYQENLKNPIADQAEMIGGIELQQIISPLRGLRISFKNARFMNKGNLLHMAVHRAVRYRSKLQLTYNLYIDSKEPDTVTFLIRHVRNECPFTLDSIQSAIGQDLRDEILRHNREWRWGWTECIGWLHPRSAHFCADEFNTEFWRGVYRAMDAYEPNQDVLMHQVRQGVNLSGWASGATFIKRWTLMSQIKKCSWNKFRKGWN